MSSQSRAMVLICKVFGPSFWFLYRLSLQIIPTGKSLASATAEGQGFLRRTELLDRVDLLFLREVQTERMAYSIEY
jgi:hypothetical protein